MLGIPSKFIYTPPSFLLSRFVSITGPASISKGSARSASCAAECFASYPWFPPRTPPVNTTNTYASELWGRLLISPDLSPFDTASWQTTQQLVRAEEATMTRPEIKRLFSLFLIRIREIRKKCYVWPEDLNMARSWEISKFGKTLFQGCPKCGPQAICALKVILCAIQNSSWKTDTNLANRCRQNVLK